MIVLDASVLIAHLSPRDSQHARATTLLHDNAEESLLVHALTMAEILVGGVRVGRGPQMLADLYAIGVRLADRDDGEPLRLAHLRLSTGLKLPDCCVLDAAENNAAAMATFDGTLARAALGRHIRVLP